ncbi:translocation/assembly module TamB domain-containing protein [Gynuella sp.]|uniref:translocation/assembly module TamB domain-containing protein n=1 Tax=Gynuella sp. TaxID=2969146 RepID=UPI003D10EA84
MSRWFRTILTIVGLLVILVSIPVAIIGTESGCRWIVSVTNRLLPALTIEGFKGSLFSGIQADKVTWKDSAVEVTVTDFSTELYLRCFWRNEICLGQSRVNLIDVAVIKKDTNSNHKTSMPDVSLPIRLRVDALNAAHLRYRSIDEQYQPLEDWINIGESMAILQGMWDHDKIVADQIDWQLGGVFVQASGELDTINSWPAKLTVSGGITPLSKEFAVQGSIDGDFDEAHYDLTFNGYGSGHAEGNIQILGHNLPIDAFLNVTSPPAQLSPYTDMFDQLQASLSGTSEGYRISLKGLYGHSQKTVSGSAVLDFSRLQQIELTISQLASLSDGSIDWSDVTTLSGKLELIEFETPGNWPLQFTAQGQAQVIAKLADNYDISMAGDFKSLHYDQYTVSDSHAELNWSNISNHYSLKAQGDIEVPDQPKTSVNVQVNSQDKTLWNIEQLQLRSKVGQQNAKGTISYSISDPAPVNWNIDGNITNTDVSFWFPDWPTLLSGHLISSGSWVDGKLLAFSLDTSMTGELLHDPVQLDIRAQKQTGAPLDIADIKASWRNSTLNARGKIDHHGAKVQFQSADLSGLYSELGNNAVNISGILNFASLEAAQNFDITQLQSSLQINADQPRHFNLLNKINMQQMSAKAKVSLTPPFNYQASLHANNWDINDIPLGALNITSSGNQHTQTFQSTVTDNKGVGMELASQLFDTGHWQGILKTLDIVNGKNHWKLSQTTQINYQNNQLNVSQTCVTNKPSKLCLNISTTDTQLESSGTMEALDSSKVLQLLNIRNIHHGLVSGRWNVEWPFDGVSPKVQLETDQASGYLDIDGKNYQYQNVRLDLNLIDQQLDGSISYDDIQGNHLVGQITGNVESLDHAELQTHLNVNDQTWMDAPKLVITRDDTGIAIAADVKLANVPLEYFNLIPGNLSNQMQFDITYLNKVACHRIPVNCLSGTVNIRQQRLKLSDTDIPTTGKILFDGNQAALNLTVGRFSYQDYQLDGNADITVDNDQWTLNQSHVGVNGQSSHIQGTGLLTDDFQTHLKITSEELQPGIYNQQLSGTLQTQAQLELNYKQDLNWQTSGSVEGMVRQREFKSQWDIAGHGNQLTSLTEAWVNWGRAQVVAKQNDNGYNINIQAPKLEEFAFGITGDIKAQTTLNYQDGLWQLTADWNSDSLSYGDLRVKQLNGTAGLNQQKSQLQLNLAYQNLSLANEPFGALTADLTGSFDSHRLVINQESGDGHGLIMDGSWNSIQNHWNGNIRWAKFKFFEHDWQTTNAVQIDYSPGKLSVSPHCWTYAQANACLSEFQRTATATDLQATLENFDVGNITEKLGQGWVMKGLLAGEISVHSKPDDISGKLALNLEQGTLILQSRGEDLVWPINNLSVTSGFNHDSISNKVSFGVQNQALIASESVIDLSQKNKTVDGTLNIMNLPMELAVPFLHPQDQISGQLNLNARFNGPVKEPEVKGQFKLTDGALQMVEYPVQIEHVELEGELNGKTATWTGHFNHPKQSSSQPATTEGTFTWDGPLKLETKIKAHRWPLKIQPYADLSVSPDMDVIVTETTLGLYGTVKVDKGEITVNKLPDQAITPSDDVVYVGEDNKPATSQDLKANLHILTTDTVKFSGYGLKGELTGDLVLLDNYQARGQIDIEEGEFESFGIKLDLTEASLTFTNTIFEPNLHAVGSNTVTDKETGDKYNIGIEVSGTLENPSAEIFSDPYLPQDTALSYLILGRPLNSSSQEENQVSEAALALGIFGTRSYAKALAENIGLESFELESEGTGEETQVVATGQINDRLSITYGYNLYGSGSQIGFRYELAKRLFVEAARGYASALSLLYSFEYD